MIVRAGPTLPIRLAICSLALALAGCDEAGDGANLAIGVAGDCVHAPEAAAATGYNFAGAPDAVRIAVAGAGSHLPCDPKDLLSRERRERHPPPAIKPIRQPRPRLPPFRLPPRL